ncbi:MAG: heavy-metal-associated domain-containing protein [Bacteriovoracia bacterium]
MKLLILLGLLVSFSALAETITFGVKGMVCSMCAQGIKKKFSSLGIDKVDVDLDQKRVTVQNEKKVVLPDAKIEALIKDAGYEVVDIKRQ